LKALEIWGNQMERARTGAQACDLYGRAALDRTPPKQRLRANKAEVAAGYRKLCRCVAEQASDRDMKAFFPRTHYAMIGGEVHRFDAEMTGWIGAHQQAVVARYERNNAVSNEEFGAMNKRAYSAFFECSRKVY
jgi:hypothetical protein